MRNIKLELQFQQKMLEYYAKVGDQELLDFYAICYYEQDWRPVAVAAICISLLDGIDNEEEYITNQIKVLDQLINEK